MRSSFPCSQCFFDVSSDSIRVEDVDRFTTCGSSSPSSSFSSLAELFRKPKSRSSFFANVRAPVIVLPTEEVHFPAKKKRDCMDQTSLWHEWASGDCRTENVAQESTAFLADSSEPTLASSGSTHPEVFSRPSRGSWSVASSFPNLGSAADISSMTAEVQTFSFPTRKTREAGSSWREERTSWQDWTTAESRKDFPPRMQSVISAGTASSPPLTNVSSFVMGRGTAIEDRSVNVDEVRSAKECCSSSNGQSGRKGSASVVVRRGAFGVSSLAEMYVPKPGSRTSGLFSKAFSSETEEVVFPKRKNRVDRNAWRDWMNSGFLDSNDDDALSQDGFKAGNLIRITPMPLPPSQQKSAPTGDSVLHTILDESDIFSAAELSGSQSPLWKRQVREEGMRAEADSAGSTMFAFRNASSFKVSGKYRRSLTRLGSHSLPVPQHMPWVQLRPIRTQGRFMLQEVKVTQPVVFQPIRSEGRLMLKLIGQQNQQMVQGRGLEGGRTWKKSVEETKMALAAREEVDVETKVDQIIPEVDNVNIVWASAEMFLNLSGVEREEVRPISQDVLNKSQKVGPELGSVALEVDGGKPTAEVDTSLRPRRVVLRSGRPGSAGHVPLVESLLANREAAAAAESPSAANSEGNMECVNSSVESRDNKVHAGYERKRYAPICEGNHPECVQFTLAEAENTGRGKLMVTETIVAAPEGPVIRKPVDSHLVGSASSCDLIIAEMEKTGNAKGGVVNQDGAEPPWFLQKAKTASDEENEGRRYITGTRVHSDGRVPDGLSVDGHSTVEETTAASPGCALVVQRNDRSVLFSGVKEIDSAPPPVRTQMPTASSAQSLLNGLVAGLGCPRASGEITLTRNLIRRNHHQQHRHPSGSNSGFSRGTGEAGMPHSSFSQQRTMAGPSLYHGMLRDAVITYTFFRSLRSRPDLHGGPDHHARLQKYVPVGAPAFSCADGMGKGHHEKNFWEQQPCVS